MVSRFGRYGVQGDFSNQGNCPYQSNNPTGALYPKEILKGIIDIARRHELIIFSDEIYDRMVFDGAVHIPIATLAPDLFVVTMNGLSKSHRICGFRVGWMVLSGPKKHVKGYIEGLNMLSNMRLCSNVLAQQVVQTSLGGYQSVDELLMPGGRLYEQREFITKAINDIPGLSAVKPKAGLYVFPKIDREMYRVEDDEQFVLDFLKQEKVLLVHGRGFNWKDPDHFRIVYLPRVDELAEIQEKMSRFLRQYRR
ncbi:Aspartate/tyrosine/aromatic aminotransferase [Streptococcus suis 98HAH33]|nr:Aspartate/tyrosine/aromatic aminotransferase [Streptococcus suis 98HAH33]